MPDLFTPRTWSDGTLVDAATGANRWESGIEALDVEVDTHGDRLDALEAATGGTTASTINAGTTGQRPPPNLGRVYFDTTLNKPIFADGSAWRDGDGALLTGGGSSNAPQNMTAVVQSDNSIVLTWSPVAGASTYKLYEVRSPNGVDGATALTSTTSTRTPSSMGSYEYWVTASIGGVESAQSNHAVCSLPFGSEPGNPPGGGTGGTPAELLNFGAGGGDWNLGVGYPSGHVDIAPGTLEDGWSEAPYFYVTEDGQRVHFQVPMNGGKTSSNTKYPRTELREYIGSSKASWSGSSGTHLLSGTTRIIHMEDDKPEIVVAQMHDDADDTLQIRCEGTTWRASINGEIHPTSLGTFAWGTDVNWRIFLDDGQLQISINGSVKINTDPGYGSGQYFKAGAYAQQNSTDQDNPPNGFASVELSNLVCSHS